MVPEVNNFKRKRANRSSCIVNPDGNCTPSDSDTDDDERDGLVQRKIARRQSIDNVDDQRQHVEQINHEDEPNHSNSSASNRSNQGNNQLLYAALRKIQELEQELAELDEADYDSGHQDEEDEIDDGNDSDFEENLAQLHDHHDQIVNGQAEALGFAFCVKETFEYLAAQGITPDNPIVTSLRERFLGQCD